MKRNLLKFALCAMALLPWERGRETLISYTFTAEDASSYGNVDGATNAWVNSQGSAIGGTVSFFWKQDEIVKGLPKDLYDKIGDFSVNSGNNPYFNEEVFGDYTYDDFWDILQQHGYVREIPFQ